jgi:oxygen-independent coproporphyrinogen-3 oxidase
MSQLPPCAPGFAPPQPAAGNYFVSNYPPFSVWTEAAVADYRRLLDRPGGEATLGLYVHIPFCVDRCHYCYYRSHEDKLAEADRYLAALAAELQRYARTPALSGRSLDFVYFGGGTPSLLSTARVERLLGALQRALPWNAACEVTFECAPRSVAVSKLRTLRQLGITRISLGVQQLDDDVLRANGRVHLVADVERAFGAIRAVGFDVVNVDLIVGLVGETDDSFFGSLERVIGMAPDSITIYQLEIPLNTPLYRSLADGTLATPPADWDRKRDRLGRAFDRIERAGYSIRSGYAAIRDPVRHRFVYQEEQYRGADLLGIGASAFSHLGGINQQNLVSLAGYFEAVERGGLPLWRAYALSDDERLVREFVLQLKLGRIDCDGFAGRFGVDVEERFAAPIAQAAAAGWLRLDARAIVLTRDGLLRADWLLRDFYRPEHRGVRYS